MKVNPKEYIDDKINDIKDKIDDVKDIIDTRIQEVLHRMEYRAEVTATALKEAKYELSAKLTIMNEWRDTIKDLIATFATRDEMNVIREQIKHMITRVEHDTLCNRIGEIERKLADYAKTDDIKRVDKSINGINKWIIGLLVMLIMILVGVIVNMATTR